MTQLIAGPSLNAWLADYPLLAELTALREVSWFNPELAPAASALSEVGLSTADIDDAADRLKRFAPYLAAVFPQTRASAGIIESPLVAVGGLQEALGQHFGLPLEGRLFAKLDSELPISGSIKARGGIYEVLAHAESLAIESGLLAPDSDYRELNSAKARDLFSGYSIAVGSTGNLGLSIGIMSAQLGFQVSVHMSSDARSWKKELLRSHGVNVVEYESDYSVAVAAGREQAAGDPHAYFIDDENSTCLFCGYAVAARRFAGQLQALEVRVDAEHPLFVYLPCGVGGGPGGVTFGLKTIFGDDVHCVFAEPTHAPCMLLGVYTGEHERISVGDFGIDGCTAADGLAVGRPSGFVGRRMQHLIDGYFTVTDDELFRLVFQTHQCEGLGIEPSAAAGLPGPWRVLSATDYRQRLRLDDARLARATHVAWFTGGSMVPSDEMTSYRERGAALS